MRTTSPIALALAAALLTACQQLPTTGPYTVTDDCRVERRASASDAGSGFSFGFGAPVFGGSRDASQRAMPSTRAGATSDAPRVPGRPSDERPSRYPERPRGGFGFGFGLPTALPAAEPDLAEQLTQSGPQFPQRFSMSCAPVQAFVRGGWPVVIDYQPDSGSEVVLEIHSVGSGEPFILPLSRGPRRQIMTADIPDGFGQTPQVALFLVRARKEGSNIPGGMQLFGLGAGPKAIGSVAIEQVEFRPDSMRVSQRQKASYSFYSRSDFNRTVVDVLRVDRTADEIKVSLARSTPLEIAINRGTWVGKKEALTWDGYDGNSRVSSGPHLLQVRAWLSAQNERDWVAAWSPSTVIVSE
jgi:hypothetical protein